MYQFYFKLEILFIIFFCSCTHKSTINLKVHDFQTVPQKIIWLQVGGLNEEHFALIKADAILKVKKLAMEEMKCTGKIWNYDLYNLRLNAFSSFLNQMTGRLNTKHSCKDYQRVAVWDYFSQQGFETLYLESGSNAQNSLIENRDCADIPIPFAKNLILWRMGSGKYKRSQNLFNAKSREQKYATGRIYDDKHCSNISCLSSLSLNVQYLFDPFLKQRGKFFAIIRDLTYLTELNKKDIKGAEKKLIEIEKTIQYFLNYQALYDHVLLIVTSAAVKNVEFPQKGSQWKQFTRTGEQMIFRRKALLSSVWAVGASSENFCGIFHEAEMFKRILVASKDEHIYNYVQ